MKETRRRKGFIYSTAIPFGAIKMNRSLKKKKRMIYHSKKLLFHFYLFCFTKATSQNVVGWLFLKRIISPEETDAIFKLSPNPTKEVLDDPFVKGGLSSLRAKRKVAENTPSSSRSASLQQRNIFLNTMIMY